VCKVVVSSVLSVSIAVLGCIGVCFKSAYLLIQNVRGIILKKNYCPLLPVGLLLSVLDFGDLAVF
jgi:hypothetical protein